VTKRKSRKDVRDVLVSVRMPYSMLKQLKNLAKLNHFLDVSEEIRTIIRKKCLQYASPYDIHVQKVVDDIHQSIVKKEEIQNKKLVIHKLKKLLDEIEHEQ
jgi:hypothetical protein